MNPCVAYAVSPLLMMSESPAAPRQGQHLGCSGGKWVGQCIVHGQGDPLHGFTSPGEGLRVGLLKCNSSHWCYSCMGWTLRTVADTE